MTDNTKMVDLPWHDGTTRTVPEGTVYEAVNGYAYYALDGGCSASTNPDSGYGKQVRPHSPHKVAVRIFTEAPEPPVKVDVPTGIGAVVSIPSSPHKPGYVLDRYGWRALGSSRTYLLSEIANKIRAGARVLFEGVDE